MILAEMWHAWRGSREMLQWYRRVHSETPALSGRELYQQIIVRRSGVASSAAALTLTRAEASLCEWPAAHALRYCDVVLYVVVAEYLKSHPTISGIQANMLSVVFRVIPREL